MNLNYVFEAMGARRLGFAAHYLTLYSVVRGLDAQHVFEFGAGLSTRVILDALEFTGGRLTSLSTDPAAEVARKRDFEPDARWTHFQGQSSDLRERAVRDVYFDVVLHDGAHDFETVRADLDAVLPRVRRGGLVLIHDTRHSHCGAALRDAMREATAPLDELSRVTLPYGFGLTILRVEHGARDVDPVRVNAMDKVGGAHRTELI